MTSRIILGMTGVAGSGKDTAAAGLVADHGFVRLAIGDELKQALCLVDPPVPFREPDGSISYIMLAELVDKAGWDQAKQHPLVRSMLQKMGSDAGWQLHGEALWTSRLDARIAELDPDQDVVVTDIRMPHEAHWLRGIGGSIIRVTRQAALEGLTPEQRAHVSEQGIADADHETANDGSVEDLHEAVLQVVMEIASYPDRSA